jgi:hypothetical protein
MVFLLVAVIVSIKLTDSSFNDSQTNKIVSEVARIEQSTTKVMSNNLMYLEGRLNNLATNQDSYQISTSRRLDVLAARQQSLENRKRDNTRIVNTNTNTVGK